MRLPPTFDSTTANKIMEEKLSTNVPYNAKVTLHGGHAGSGWCQKHLEDWLHKALNDSAHAYFNQKDYGSYGEGGSIPFLKQLEIKYPETQIIAMGVVGPHANIHGPNENINLVYVRKVIKTLAHVIAEASK
jgi:acetylornithine deacetylase/succinyl-diaminopimelate desuccinylase-like protein